MKQSISLSIKSQKYIKALMDDCGITQKEVADITRVSKADINKMLNPLTPSQVAALRVIFSKIKAQRPDVDINEVLNM